MIVEFVRFPKPEGWTREDVLADARTVVEKWRADPALVRKHFLMGEDGMLGAFYIWPSRKDAERAHDAAWRTAVAEKTGAAPAIDYFDLTMVIDNAAGTVTEFERGEGTGERDLSGS
ncbi:MAG: hypothetical protein KGM42_09485 [Hyphomicrobiales bacterium]|nr:hypothetical protein [Hyphomicrobiales bacterium]